MHQVWFGIGSNLERERHIAAVLLALETDFSEVRLSSIYETEAAGFTGPPFYNLVAWVETSLPLPEVQQWCKNLEQQLGRQRNQLGVDRQTERYSSKTIDIDILLFNDLIATQTNVTPALPRAEILTSPFVLAPLAELVPHMCHPETGLSYAEHWRKLNEQLAENGLMGKVALNSALLLVTEH